LFVGSKVKHKGSDCYCFDTVMSTIRDMQSCGDMLPLLVCMISSSAHTHSSHRKAVSDQRQLCTQSCCEEHDNLSTVQEVGNVLVEESTRKHSAHVVIIHVHAMQ